MTRFAFLSSSKGYAWHPVISVQDVRDVRILDTVSEFVSGLVAVRAMNFRPTRRAPDDVRRQLVLNGINTARAGPVMCTTRVEEWS